MTWKPIPTLKSISTVFGLLTFLFLFIVSDYLLTPEATITCQENLKSSSSIRIPRRCNGVVLYESDFVLITKPVLVPLRSGLFPNPFVLLIILSPITLCIVIIIIIIQIIRFRKIIIIMGYAKFIKYAIRYYVINCIQL